MSIPTAFRYAYQHLPSSDDPDIDPAPVHDPSGWRSKARREQLPPAGAWDIWYVRGGRGSGKTWTCANAFAELILNNDPGEWGVVAPTLGDVRTTCFESDESGLIRALGGQTGPGGELIIYGPHIARWNRSSCELYLTNGSIVYGDGGDDGALRLQGKNLRGAWCDELGLWKKWQTAWDESIGFAVRKQPAKIIASGTPKRGMPAIVLVKRLLASAKSEPTGSIRTTLLRTIDNLANLAGAALTRMRLLEGTALGRQELEGEVLEEAEGALWTRDPAKAMQHGLGLLVNEPKLLVPRGRTVVAVDPDSGGAGGDGAGFVVAAQGLDHRLYVLASEETQRRPVEQIRHARELFDVWRADAVVVEKNHGQGWLVDLFREVDPLLPVTVVDATQNKRTRAEPIAALYVPRPDQPAPVVHVGDGHEVLEDQQTTFTGLTGEVSPNALDALVWALWALTHGGGVAVTTEPAVQNAPPPLDSLPAVDDVALLRMEL